MNFNYVPTEGIILSYILTDVFISLLLTFERYFSKEIRHDLSFRYGEIQIYILSVFAYINFMYQNHNYIFVNKNEYISNLIYLTPNLFIITIPAESILVGAGFYPPFKNNKFNILCKIVAAIVVMLSFSMGYRHLLFLSLLLLLFKSKRISMLFPLFLFSFFGNFSDVIKYAISGYLYNGSYSFSENISYVFSNIENFIRFSGEQSSIVSNLSLGLDSLNEKAIIDALNILPMASLLNVEWGAETTSRLGDLVGVGLGQGTAYNFQLFVLETYGAGLVFLFFIFVIHRMYGLSIFSVYILEVLYSILRNGPAFYTGQLKMLFMLLLLTVFINFVISSVVSHKDRKRDEF
ncbi:hypothetical protein ACSZNH_00605 [Aeromonas dhakensis]|uniref:hypothetical protein n=1 Tax=Aeromonas dhakensis TaxID=196024 RepID=UPI003EC8778A